MNAWGAECHFENEISCWKRADWPCFASDFTVVDRRTDLLLSGDPQFALACCRTYETKQSSTPIFWLDGYSFYRWNDIRRVVSEEEMVRLKKDGSGSSSEATL